MARMEDFPTLRKAMYAFANGKIIGEGEYRTVYRLRSGRWVYKVDSHTHNSVGTNLWEWETYKRYSQIELPENVKFPEMYLLEGNVIAAEYVKGKHPDNECYRTEHVDSCPGKDVCWAEAVKDIPIGDLHSENVLISPNGTVYIIDLGCGES